MGIVLLSEQRSGEYYAKTTTLYRAPHVDRRDGDGKASDERDPNSYKFSNLRRMCVVYV